MRISDSDISLFFFFILQVCSKPGVLRISVVYIRYRGRPLSEFGDYVRC